MGKGMGEKGEQFKKERSIHATKNLILETTKILEQNPDEGIQITL